MSCPPFSSRNKIRNWPFGCAQYFVQFPLVFTMVLKSKLRSQKQEFQSHIDENRAFHLFMGNEASDLDSVASALASSLLSMQEKRQQIHSSSTSYVAPPITVALLPLRFEHFRRLNTDSVFALKLLDIRDNEFQNLVRILPVFFDSPLIDLFLFFCCC